MLYEIYPVMYYDKDKLYVRILSYGVIYKRWKYVNCWVA